MNVSKLYFTIFSICSILGTGGCQPPQPAPSLTQRTSIADREKWKASDFFEDSRQRELCEAISDGDTNLLMRLLDSDASLNEPGKYGVTVLYWAYLEDDFGAFKSLLERGADPDRRLEANIPSRHFQFAKEDSVLFSSLRHLYGKYCVAALKYSHDVNQRDRVGNNLLNVYLWPGADVTERDLQELVDSGIDLNAKGELLSLT